MKKKKRIPGIFLRQSMTQGKEFLFRQLTQILVDPAWLEYLNVNIDINRNLFSTIKISLAGLYIYSHVGVKLCY